MLKFYKMIFFNFMVLGTLMAISSYSWMSMWMGLEINLLSIIPLFSSTKNMLSSEAALKYFITQAMASMILLFSIILLLSWNEFIAPSMNLTLMMLLNSALLTKLGAAPFHFWFPEVMEGLNWTNSLILLTWQKIAPMSLLMNNYMNPLLFFFIIIVSLIISTMLSFNQISLRKIMAYSSINHIAWMLSTMLVSPSIWLVYFLVYTIINTSIILIFMITKSFSIPQIAVSLSNSKLLKFLLMINFMSLGGLPPFIGFLPKWITINWMINLNLYFITLCLIVLTLIMLFVYIQISFSAFIFNSIEFKNFNPSVKNFWMILFSFFSTNSLVACTLIFNLM